MNHSTTIQATKMLPLEKPQRNQGFTLLELSIVLVIIGLIIGGVTVGADLIRAAELNSVISEVNKYKVAVNAFKLKYNAVPGDMKNATDYWGTSSGGCPDGGGFETCNGNGDGDTTYNTLTESSKVFNHLSRAEVISGSYESGDTVIFGTTYPEPLINNASLQFLHPWSASGIFGYTKDNFFILGSINNNVALNGPAISPQDAKLLDSKTDDGLPDSGKILGSNGYSSGWFTGCTANGYTSANAGGDYLVANENNNCILFFK